MSEPNQQEQPRARSWRLPVVAALLATLVLLSLFCTLLWFAKGEAEFPLDASLVKTAYPTGSISPGAGLISRLMYRYLEYRQRKQPKPGNWSFPVSVTNRCSVHGLLNQCMEITGQQYVIEKNVAAGTVQFGADHVQNGAEWAQSFEQTLLQGPVEWWDPDQRGFQRKPIVLLRYGLHTTLVVSEETAQRYERDYPQLQKVAVTNNEPRH